MYTMYDVRCMMYVDTKVAIRIRIMSKLIKKTEDARAREKGKG